MDDLAVFVLTAKAYQIYRGRSKYRYSNKKTEVPKQS